MRTTLAIDDEVLEAARSRVQADRKSLGQVISELARKGLTCRSKASSDPDLPIGSHSFGVVSALRYYEDVVRSSYADFIQEPQSPRRAIVFSVVAYHLREWVWHDRGGLDFRASGLKRRSKESFYESVNVNCPSFPILREIVNGSKHCVLAKPERVTRADIAAWGELAWGEFAWGRPTLMVELGDGTRRNVESVFEEVAGFWGSFFAKQADGSTSFRTPAAPV